MSLLKRAYFLKSAPLFEYLPDDTGAEIAFIGYSNTGKSSTLNKLTQCNLARISKTPGRTQMFNVFALDSEASIRLVDLPGYGYAKVPKALKAQWLKRINHYLTYRTSLKGLVLIMDIRHPFKPFDRELIEWCLKTQHPVHGLLNKSDKLSYGKAKEALQSCYRDISKCYDLEQSDRSAHFTLQLFSAKTGLGLLEAEQIIQKLLTTKPL